MSLSFPPSPSHNSSTTTAPRTHAEISGRKRSRAPAGQRRGRALTEGGGTDLGLFGVLLKAVDLLDLLEKGRLEVPLRSLPGLPHGRDDLRALDLVEALGSELAEEDQRDHNRDPEQEHLSRAREGVLSVAVVSQDHEVSLSAEVLSSVHGLSSKELFNPEELVVLGDPI